MPQVVKMQVHDTRPLDRSREGMREVPRRLSVSLCEDVDAVSGKARQELLRCPHGRQLLVKNRRIWYKSVVLSDRG